MTWRNSRFSAAAKVCVSESRFCHRRARGRKCWPASVRVMRRWPLPWWNRGAPTWSSSDFSRADRDGWVMYSASAAAVMVPWSSTAKKVSISWLVIGGSPIIVYAYIIP